MIEPNRSVLVLSWSHDTVTFAEIGAALAAVGFEAFRLMETEVEHGNMIAVPLLPIDSEILGKYVHHVLNSRLDVWNTSSTTWTAKGWADIKGDVTLEKLT